MEIVVNLVMIVLIAGITYALASEGLWGATLMFFNVVFAGIIAFNFYETLAALLDGTGIGWGYSDTLCMMALFIVALVLLRLTTETLAPSMVRFPTPVYHLGRVVFGAGTALVTMGILLLAFEAAPIHKKIFGVIDYKTKPPFGMALDREWLSFFQYTTGQVFAAYSPNNRDPFGEYGTAKVFDPNAEWLLNHQEWRPYGEGSIMDAGDTAAATPAAAGAAPAAGGAAPQGAPPGQGGPGVIMPGGPGGGVVVPQ